MSKRKSNKKVKQMICDCYYNKHKKLACFDVNGAFVVSKLIPNTLNFEYYEEPDSPVVSLTAEQMKR